MRKFISELKGKTVMTSDGVILGKISNVTVDMSTGQVLNVLIDPLEEIVGDDVKKDATGRLVVEFRAMKYSRDVVVIDMK